MRDVLLVKYYPVSKKLNHKDKVKNFVSLPGESVSSSWDRFTAFVRSVPNNHIDDESLKEYFYQAQDDNNKAVLNTIVGGSYGECIYVEIAEKLEKISRNNKAWSIRKSDTRRNTFTVRATYNFAADEIREEMTQMRIEIRLILKHLNEGAEKVNAVNYLTKQQLPVDEYYYEEDTYAVIDQTRGFRQNTQGSYQYNRNNNFNRDNYGNRYDRSGPYVPPQNWKWLVGMMEIVWRKLRICYRR